MKFCNCRRILDIYSQSLLNSSGSNMNGNTQSNQAAVSVGVAHGTVLGPLFFIFYVKDLPNVLEFALLLLVC